MFEDEKIIRTIEMLRGSRFTAHEASEVFNDLPGKKQRAPHNIIRVMRRYAIINKVGRSHGFTYYEVE